MDADEVRRKQVVEHVKKHLVSSYFQNVLKPLAGEKSFAVTEKLYESMDLAVSMDGKSPQERASTLLKHIASERLSATLVPLVGLAMAGPIVLALLGSLDRGDGPLGTGTPILSPSSPPSMSGGARLNLPTHSAPGPTGGGTGISLLEGLRSLVNRFIRPGSPVG
jgi:hypothetical protein